MDGRSVLLAKIPWTEIKDEDFSSKYIISKFVFLSSSLKHILILVNNTLSLFCLSKPSDFEHKGASLVWEEIFLDLESVVFSDDGKRFALLQNNSSQPKKLILFNISKNIISKECEVHIVESGQSFSNTSKLNDNVCDLSVDNNKPDTVLIHLKKNHVVMYSCGCLSSFLISPSNGYQQNYLVTFNSDVLCYYYNIQFFYYVDCSGIVYKYLLENGSLVGTHDIFKTLPRSLKFNRLCIDLKGTHLALLDSTNHVYILDVTFSSVPLLMTSFPQSSAPDSSSVSVSSFKTSTSKTSNNSRVDSLRRESTNKTIGSIACASTVSSSWLTYLEKLTNRKKYVLGKEEEWTSFTCIQDVPNTYNIQSLHFCQDSLGIWATGQDGTSDGFYRLYNKCSGQLDSADILASDTKVIPVDAPKVSIDLFIQGSNICLPLGVISRDTLVQKMVGGENESLVGEMIGQAVLPLPLLREGMSSLQIDMVRLALNLHTQGLKLQLTEAIDTADHLVISVKHIFETILSALDQHDLRNEWHQQIKRLALTHANTLLSLLQYPDTQVNLQTEILHYIVLLRRGEATSVDIPDIPQWTSLLTLSDEEVIFSSITSLPLVRCFLILHRSWTEDDFQGKRFYNTVNRVFVNLLKEKRLQEAIQLLEKVNLDPTQELKSLSMTCQDLTLRDFLFSNLNDVLQTEHYDAWQYITLIESVLDSYKQYFPEVTHSPMKICDVLSFSSNDKLQIITDLFFCTGEHTLKKYLEKISSWSYLLSHNYAEGISIWLSSKNIDSQFLWPEELFVQWDVDELMVDQVAKSDCTALTKLVVCNQLALLGIFINPEKCSLKKLILRMAYAEVFPDVETVLAQESSNLSYLQLSDLIYCNAVKNNLVDIAIISFDQSEVRDDKDCPDWLTLFKQHTAAGKSWNTGDIAKAIEGTTQYLASSEQTSSSLYLKKHPIIALVTDVINNEDVCQLHSHVSPLLAACTPPSLPSHQSVDITLYSILANTVPFHTDNIYQHQINEKQSSTVPDFKNANLSLRYGINYSLGFKDFIKQGRPASAFCYSLQKGKSFVRKKVAVNQTHGLALSNACSYRVTSACLAFTELIGQDSSLLRTHVTSAFYLKKVISENKLKELLFNLTQGKEDGAAELVQELERCFINMWKWDEDNWIHCLRDFQLVVRMSTFHHLPSPQGLLEYCLETQNWLLFMVAAQLFQLPLSTVQQATLINSRHILSKHLFYALQNTISNHSENEPIKTFQPETNLFACLAVNGNNANALLRCSHDLNSPALALLASSLQYVPTETGLSMWFTAALLPEDVSLCPSPPWTADSVTQLLEVVVKRGYFYTLAHGFSIYLPNSPLCALANFLLASVVKRRFKESVLNLKVFLAEFFNMPCEDPQTTNFLIKKSWLATASYRMVCTALAYCFSSRHLRFCFLKTLCEVKFSEVIKDSQCLPLYLRLSECLANTSLELDWVRLCLHQDCTQLMGILSSLTESHLFDVAFQFAQTANLQPDQVLTTQWSVLALSDKRQDRDFWKQCDDKFQQVNVKPQVAVNFYRNQVKMCDKSQERYFLLKYALNWLRKTSATKDEITSLQSELYMTCLQDNFKIEVLTEGVVPVPLRCLSNSLMLIPVKTPTELKVTQSHRLDVLIHQLLFVGDIKTAFELQALFHHTNQDCELILACMHLAEGMKNVSQLPSRIQEYLTDEIIKKPKVPLSSPFPKLRLQTKSYGCDNQEILSALYALQAHQTCTTSLFGNIISAFKVSVDLGCNYKDIILDAEPLNRLLPTHDIETAASLLSLASLTRSEGSQYICSQIVSVLNTVPDDGRYTLWGHDLENEFSSILDLSSSALLLGNLLLSSDPLIAPSSEPSSYKQVVELLVLAHNCFTKVCHMEGIAAVLNLSRSLVNSLLDCYQWPLMVRLLIGIGRYNEMNYIFKILKSNDRFEFLLGKGLNKQPQLMSATLEFVRRDKELFSLVAHRFSMYGELAALYEEEALTELSHLTRAAGDGSLLVSVSNKAYLQAALSKYSDAAEHYMQAKKMKCGVASVQQAELIAVQLSLIKNCSGSTVPCLVSLTQTQALELANTVLSYEEAHIVANAYNISIDWSSAIYFNCVIKGNLSYLTIWTKHHQLCQSIVQDVVRRFQSEREMSQSVEVNMKWFVSSISLLDVKYRVASQLGFKDILQNMLNNPDMAYLKDTVWQSGFKKQPV